MPGLINDQLINQLRRVAYKQLITPCTIRRVTRTEGPFEMVETWADVFSTTCWYKPSYTAKVDEQIGFIGRVENAEIRFRWGEDVRLGDRIVVGGNQYHVQDTNDGATIALYLKAYGEVVT